MSHSSTLRDRIHKIHVAVNDGSLDRASINDALADLTKLADDIDGKTADKPEPKIDAPKSVNEAPPAHAASINQSTPSPAV